MNALRKVSLLQQQFQTTNDEGPPASSRTSQDGVEFVSQERMSLLGLEGPGLPLAVPAGEGRLRQALTALLKGMIKSSQLLLAFLVGLRVPLRRAQHVLREHWPAAVDRMRRVQHLVLERWVAAVGLMRGAQNLPLEHWISDVGRPQRAPRVLLKRWMAADFRTRQLPILAIAATIWAATAWTAWRSQDSSTPLLRENLAAISQRVQSRELAEAPASVVVAQPVNPQDAVASRGLTPQISASLSLDRILTFLLSRPAPEPERPGNPRLEVWADTHTGLYYCPGDTAYRWKSRGHFMSQKEAQNNYFRPASGAACP